jgi:uncharacterized protein DUF3306
MSENEDFLSRWSRRKREARTGQSEPEPTEPVEASSHMTSQAAAGEPDQPEIDLSDLPPIETIDGATDISAFLRKGVPQELSRAALRQAWSADPSIRDFVGLAENAWDFNDPNAMPGFGPLDCSQAELSALADRIIGNLRQAAETLPTTQPEIQQSRYVPTPECGPAEQANRTQLAEARAGNTSADTDTQPNPAASQPATLQQPDHEAPVPRRTHGSALPR